MGERHPARRIMLRLVRPLAHRRLGSRYAAVGLLRQRPQFLERDRSGDEDDGVPGAYQVLWKAMMSSWLTAASSFM